MPFFVPSWWWKWWQEQNGNQPDPAPSDGVFRWFHRERDPQSVSVAALVTAKSGGWTHLDKKTRTRQFRAFVLMSLQIAPLRWEPVPLGELGPHLYSTEERNAAGAVIARTLVLLTPPGLKVGSDVVSEEWAPATGSIEDTGAGVLVVLLWAACAISAAWLGTTIADAAHAINFDDEVTNRLLAAQARAIEILTLHVERERIAGHELPFDEQERALLVGLEEQQRQLATLQRRPLPKPFEGASEFLRSAAKATTSALPLALAVLVALVFLNQSNRRS